MVKQAHGFPVGMMAVNGVGGGTPGGSTPQQLVAELKRVYEGEPAIPYEACNHVQSYGDADSWDEGNNEPSNWCDRITNNINGWIVFLQQVKSVCDDFGAPPGTVKALISRNLVSLVRNDLGAGHPRSMAVGQGHQAIRQRALLEN